MFVLLRSYSSEDLYYIDGNMVGSVYDDEASYTGPQFTKFLWDAV